jgi:hypothetical protein
VAAAALIARTTAKYPAALTNLENSSDLCRFSGPLAVAASIVGESAVMNGLPTLGYAEWRWNGQAQLQQYCDQKATLLSVLDGIRRIPTHHYVPQR